MALRACGRLLKTIKAASDASEYDSDDEKAGEAFTVADEDKIMTYMIDCLLLLAVMQQRKQRIPADSADALRTRNKLFLAAFSIVGGNSLKIDTKEQPTPANAAINQLMKAFPVPHYEYPDQTGREGWLPLHWAAALMSSGQYNVTETDVETLYASDPTAIQTNHVDEHYDDECVGLTPVHLLCMNPVTQCSMRFIRSLSLCSLAAFVPKSDFSALHAACRFGAPTVELLQHLLQLDCSQAKLEVELNGGGPKHCPLGCLCINLMKRDGELPNAMELVN